MRSTAGERAIRDAFDTVATDYARLLPDLTAEAPLDRAVLAAFLEMVREGSGDGLVIDVGCGSGRVTAHLADAGLRMVGMDLSDGMVRVARSARQDIPYAVAHAGVLPLRTGTIAGLLAWYSVINLPTGLLPTVFAEFARVMRSGALIVLAFQSGEGERVDRTTSYGQRVPMTYYRHRVEEAVQTLADSGFAMHATVHREPSQAHETCRQAFLLAQRA